ncbi:hypothetical protein CRENBAI_000939 [Crenichthys baileyi]|uniref:Uncharacterized protein n=1 Tax=Crenichthys baileyi TaxID=28760 RepID=A0AAV9R6W1_9TELE
MQPWTSCQQSTASTKHKTTHLIFDVYNPSSLNAKTRSKEERGRCKHRTVTWSSWRSSRTTAIVDKARLDRFAGKQRPYGVIPPTRAALLQHTRHATYQVGYAWAQATQCQPEVESPADWEWQVKRVGQPTST